MLMMGFGWIWLEGLIRCGSGNTTNFKHTRMGSDRPVRPPLLLLTFLFVWKSSSLSFFFSYLFKGCQRF